MGMNTRIIVHLMGMLLLINGGFMLLAALVDAGHVVEVAENLLNFDQPIPKLRKDASVVFEGYDIGRVKENVFQ